MTCRNHLAQGLHVLSFFWMASAFVESGWCERERFQRPESEALEVWRLTNDPTVRDHANYHNTQCWSPDGHYVCFTHYASDGRTFGAKSAAEIHLFDLLEDRDVRLDRGLNPRWANRRKWLFYTQPSPEDGPSHDKGTRVLWHDLETGRRTRIAYGVQELKQTDCGDRWLYGMQTPEDGRRRAVRVAIQPNVQPETLPGDWGVGYNSLYVNPMHPMIVSRDHNFRDYYYSPDGTREIPLVARHFFDHDLAGESRTRPFPLMEGSHFSWIGDGSYFLAGNGPVRGRKWNEPLPANIHLLANISMGDICPCGFSGRWICGSTGGGRGPLRVADLRSGDGWVVMKTHSFLCFPGSKDNSGPYDIDAKGSPDGTKIAFVSTYDLKDGPVAEIVDNVSGDRILVDSTDEFPESGRLVNPAGFGGEVLGYRRKTPHSFEGLTRGLYNTSAGARLRKGGILISFDALVIPADQRAGLPRPASWIRSYVPEPDSPLRWQRSSDIYVAVVRVPDRPCLRASAGGAELIPGENHWETRGYDVLRNGRRITAQLVRPGEEYPLPVAGDYAAVAVEWSGLQSQPSQPLTIDAPSRLRVRSEAPTDFVWTTKRYLSAQGEVVSEEDARRAAKAVCEIVHVSDGVIHRERLCEGQVVMREDLNVEGKPMRRLLYDRGILVRRDYYDRDGNCVSTEHFDTDGFINRSIGHGSWQWTYDRGVPTTYEHGSARYLRQGDRWVRQQN